LAGAATDPPLALAARDGLLDSAAAAAAARWPRRRRLDAPEERLRSLAARGVPLAGGGSRFAGDSGGEAAPDSPAARPRRS